MTQDMFKFLKHQEAAFENCLPAKSWIVLRIDGRNFSVLTEENFEKPFDERFNGYMLKVAKVLLEKYHAAYIYVGSDEISMALPPAWNEYDRRQEKLVSLTAAAASVGFALEAGLAVEFDSRICLCTNDSNQVAEYFMARFSDVRRCAIQTAAYWTLRNEGVSPKGATGILKGIPWAQKEQLLQERSLPFDQLPLWQQQGAGVIWESYEKIGYDPKKNKEVVALRRRAKENLHLPHRSEEYRQYLLSVLQ